MKDSSNDSELWIFEIEQRLEFGAALIDSDLDADDNSGCVNSVNCGPTNNPGCYNGSC